MSHFQYDRHGDHWRDVATSGRSGAPSHVDDWRHNRMYAALDPFIRPGENWLTVGDGRFGRDGRYIMARGAEVHCSDISEDTLAIAAAEGHIANFSAQNAEALTFSDNSFDYVYCKESFHHFPRPYIALHEMFRVARKAVILTEPRDIEIDRAPFGWLLSLANRIRGKTSTHEFEEIGNFVYRISEREMEKFLLGMHHRHIAFKPLNDAYLPTHRAVRRNIAIFDILHRFGIRKSRILNAALFKSPPAQKPDGWNMRILPKNPYL